MTHSEKISVVIPVYNVEPYLKKCVESVCRQTYENLEIILVDDGSTDRSGAICDELKKQDCRIVVIHQENQGLSVARNTGIEKASGSWIAFLDSDDWIEPEMYQVLLQLAMENSAQISSCATRKQILGEAPNQKMGTGEISILTPEEMIAGLYTQDKVRYEVWNKLWSRELIGDTRFIKEQVSEDVHFDRILFLRANKMAFIDCCFHNYLVNRPGSTNSSFKINRLCIFDEFDSLMEDIKKLDNKYLESVVSCIASDFALGIYEEAVDKQQNPEILKKLRQSFLHFYSVDSSKKVESKKNKVKKLLFRWNPKVFLKLRSFIN